MALQKRAEQLKREMMEAVTLRRELETVDAEWHDLWLALDDGDGGEGEWAVIQAVYRERQALRRRLVQRQLSNWARLCGAPLTPLQRRLMGLRFVRGCPWSDIVARLQKAKQYLLREHNKALERLADGDEKKAAACLVSDRGMCDKIA